MAKVKTGKASIVKGINTKNILDIIRRKGPISRIEIAEITGLTPATITNITSELIDKKLIVEAEAGDSSGGRKPIMLRIRTDYYRVIGIYIGSMKIKIIAADLMKQCELSASMISALVVSSARMARLWEQKDSAHRIFGLCLLNG